MKESAPHDHLEEDSTSEDSFCLQVKIKCTLDMKQEVPRPKHLITNLACRLKPHHTRNLYLRARLDTCVDMNLMPDSVYKLVFNDSKMQKLAPSNLQLETYTTETVKIFASCKFYLVHPDTKKLMELTFYVAMNDGMCFIVMQKNLIPWPNTTKVKIGLPPTKNKSHYKLRR